MVLFQWRGHGGGYPSPPPPPPTHTFHQDLFCSSYEYDKKKLVGVVISKDLKSSSNWENTTLDDVINCDAIT